MDGGNLTGIEVRPGTVEDLPAAFELLQRMHEEVGEAPIDLQRVAYVLAAVQRDGFLIMAFGPDGRPAGTMGVQVGGYWYSAAPCLRDTWAFVDPPFRGKKVLESMIDAAKDIAAGMQLPLYVGVTDGGEHLEAKERIMGRQLKRVGVLFVHRPAGM